MNKKIRMSFSFLFLLCVLLFSQNIMAQSTWYVENVNGSNDYNGLSQQVTSESGPKKTITNAVDAALNGDTIVVVSTGLIYGTQNNEADTIRIAKEIVLESLDGKITIDVFVHIDSTDHVLFNGRYELLKDMTIAGNLELSDTLSLKANLNLSSSDTLNLDFKVPLVLDGEDDQFIYVPVGGAKMGSFEIRKPSGNIILEGGNLDLSKEITDTNYNKVIFRKGLFITGDNTLILQAPAGTPELGFIHDPLLGDISHVVGTIGIDPKMETDIDNWKTTWPVGDSSGYYCPFSLTIPNTVSMNLGDNISASYVNEQPIGTNGLPIEFNERLYTRFPYFYWILKSNKIRSYSSLGYGMEFSAPRLHPETDIDEIIIVHQHINILDGERTWWPVYAEFENIWDEEVAVFKLPFTAGVIQNVSKAVTLGFPTHLSIAKELPDLNIYNIFENVDLDSVFVGNIGAFSYHASASNPLVVNVDDKNFTEASFVIESLCNGRSDIIVTATDESGDFISDTFKIDISLSGVEQSDLNKIPLEYSLSQNYPNPFNPETTIRFGLPETVNVSLKIYNVLGEAVKTLVSDEELRAGYHQYSFDGSNISSGIYFYELVAGKYRTVKKMLLLK